MTTRRFELRFYGLMCIVTACLVLMYLATFRGDPVVTDTILISVIFLGVGLTFATIMTGLTFRFMDLSIFDTILWTGASVGIILVVNRLVPISFDVTSGVSERWMGVLVGIAEECFFRLWLCGLASRFSEWGAIIGSSAIWSAYHVARYGGNPNILLIVFLCGLALGWIYLHSRLGDGVIFAHGLVNFLAVS